MDTRPEKQATYRQVFADPIFRVLFFTRAVSITADTLRTIALSVLVLANTGSAFLSAVTFGISFLPQLIGSSLLGAVADRQPPRRLIAVGYGMESGVAVLLALGNLPVWAILTLVAAVASVTSVFNGASGKAMADALTDDRYVLARSLTGMSSSLAQVAGLAGGGIAVQTLGTHQALLVSALLHLLASAWVRLRLPRLPASDHTTDTGAVRQSLLGNWRLLTDPEIRILLLAQWLPPMFLVGADSLLIPFAGPGPLLVCPAIGMLLGSFTVGRFLRPAVRERLLVPLIVLTGLPLFAFAVDGLPITVYAVLLVISGSGFAYGLAVQRRFRDAVPDAVRGQAFGLMSTGLMTLQGMGPVLAGTVAEVVPIGVTIALTGVATVVSAGVFWFRIGQRR